jgi:hypothetical protein
MMVTVLGNGTVQGIAVGARHSGHFETYASTSGFEDHDTQRPWECIHGTTRNVDGCGTRGTLDNILNIQIEYLFMIS